MQSISTLTLHVPLLPTNHLPNLESWLRSVLWDSQLPPTETGARTGGFTVHRTKGQIFVQDGRVLMIQGVRDVFEIIDHTTSASRGVAGSAGAEDESAVGSGKIVLIGKGLGGVPFQESLDRAFLAGGVS